MLTTIESQGPVFVASAQGGVDIEGVAAENPDAIITMPIDIKTGPTEKQTLELAKKIGFTPKCVADAAATMRKLYKLFIEKDATMVEINPMAESALGEGE